MPLSPHDQQLFHAIQAQDMQAAQQAVQAGANIHVQTLEGMPLHAAVKVKHLGLVQWLVKQGADINLIDAAFKTPIEIAATSKQADILAYLLEHRQSLSASQLNYILMACVAKHPTTETEDYHVDTQLINFIVSRLTRLNVHALLTTNRNWERVIVQLFSIKGEKREGTVLSEGASAEQLQKEGAWVGLEGWRQHEFLAIRIRALFELYLRISVEDMRKQALYSLLPQATADANVAAILNALQQELLTTIETLATYHDTLAIKSFLPSKRVQLRQAIARNVTAKVQVLADGREYPLACGWGDARKGHALYVSLMVYPQHIVPRIDNTDVDNNRDVNKNYHEYTTEQRPRDDQAVTKIVSYVPGQWDKLETQPIQNYIEALLEAMMAGKAESFAKIYQPVVKPLTVSLNLPGTQIQTIGNCPVKNHHVSLRIRLKDKAFYRWVRREESKIIISLHAAKDQPLDISAYWTLWQANLTVEVTPSTAAFHLQTHLLRSLKASYAKHGYINRLFSAYTNHQEDSLAINKSYIHLAITPEETQKQKEQQAFKSLKPANTAQLSQAIYENTETVDMQQLFESAKAKGKQQIAVIGRPGVGKSTFCQYVALQWAEGADWLSQYQWLFWIEARNLKSAWYEKKSYYELIDIVARECFNRPLSNLEVAILQQAIDQNRVLWLIDGHDALAGQTLSANLDEIVESLLAKAPLVMTTRPFYLPLSPNFFHIEITGFTQNDITVYVQHFFNTLKTPQTDKAHQLLEYMRQNPYVWELGRIPLQLELLCSVYLHETLQGQKILTQTELYQKIRAWLLRRYLIERKKVKPENIDDDMHVEWLCQDALRLLKQLAFDEFQKGNTILSQNAINQYRETLFKTLSPPEWLALKKELAQLGLFTKVYRNYESTSLTDEDYYFIHPTFQELMAASFIARHIETNQAIPVFKEGKVQELLAPKQFIAKYKYHPQYLQVWKFVAGLQKDFTIYLNYLNDEPLSLGENIHINLLTDCLVEVKDISKDSILQLQSQFSSWLDRLIKQQYISREEVEILKRCKFSTFYSLILDRILITLDSNDSIAMSNSLIIINVLIIKNNKIFDKLLGLLNKHSEEAIKRQIIYVLGNIISPNDSAYERITNKLLALIYGSTISIKESAITALSTMKYNSKKFISLLKDYLNQRENNTLRVSSLYALCKVLSNRIEIEKILLESSFDKDSLMRISCARIIGDTSDLAQDLFNRLVNLLNDGDYYVQKAAKESIIKFSKNNSKLCKILLENYRERARLQQQEAEFYIKKIIAEKSRIIDILKKTDMSVEEQIRCLFVLSQVASVLEFEDIQLIFSFLFHSNNEICNQAKESLALINKINPLVVDTIRKYINGNGISDDQSIIYYLLGKLADADKTAIPLLLEGIDSSSVTIQTVIIWELGLLGMNRSLSQEDIQLVQKKLIKCLNTSYDNIFKAIIEALTKFLTITNEALGTILRLLDDKDISNTRKIILLDNLRLCCWLLQEDLISHTIVQSIMPYTQNQTTSYAAFCALSRLGEFNNLGFYQFDIDYSFFYRDNILFRNNILLSESLVVKTDTVAILLALISNFNKYTKNVLYNICKDRLKSIGDQNLFIKDNILNAYINKQHVQIELTPVQVKQLDILNGDGQLTIDDIVDYQVEVTKSYTELTQLELKKTYYKQLSEIYKNSYSVDNYYTMLSNFRFSLACIELANFLSTLNQLECIDRCLSEADDALKIYDVELVKSFIELNISLYAGFKSITKEIKERLFTNNWLACIYQIGNENQDAGNNPLDKEITNEDENKGQSTFDQLVSPQKDINGGNSNTDKNKEFTSKGINHIYPIKTIYKWHAASISFRDLKLMELKKVLQAELIDQQLLANGLKRGTATVQGNNCLLDSYFQLIKKYFKAHLQEKNIGNFDEFANSIRSVLNKNNNEMLMVNDELEGIQLLTAIQQYLKDKTKLNFGFDLTLLVALPDGIVLVDNLDELQSQVNNKELIIPISLIQVNYNHYEPVFQIADSFHIALTSTESILIPTNNLSGNKPSIPIQPNSSHLISQFGTMPAPKQVNQGIQNNPQIEEEQQSEHVLHP